MATIGFIPHPCRPEAVNLAMTTAAWLTAAGHRAPILTGPGGEASEGSESAVDLPMCDGGLVVEGAEGPQAAVRQRQREIARQLDLAISLGGDGTMLRVVDLVAPFGVPVLGVNVGHLGFLTEVAPDELPQALKRFLAGEYRVEERMTLAVEVRTSLSERPPRITTALNDVVLQRSSLGHTVQLGVCINGSPFLTYAADSLIVATPTGSTAYNLSARGPIASPRTRVLVMTPVAAHMLFDRSLVLAEEENVTFEILGDLPAELVVDGQMLGSLSTGDVVRCRAGDHNARLVDFGGRDFHRVLKQKFGSADR